MSTKTDAAALERLQVELSHVIEGPTRQSKPSPVNTGSDLRWLDYHRAHDEMMTAANTPHAVRSIAPPDDSGKMHQPHFPDLDPRPAAEARQAADAPGESFDEAPRRIVSEPGLSPTMTIHTPNGDPDNDRQERTRSERPRAERGRLAHDRAGCADEGNREAREGERRRAQELDDFTASFLGEQVNEKELTMIRRLVMNAVKDGKFEALVYSFPSDLCTDSGRAINNGDPRWPDTLRGKAKELYDRFMVNAKPKGYRLKAMVINFPGGMPGDIGFFVNWAPEHT